MQNAPIALQCCKKNTMRKLLQKIYDYPCAKVGKIDDAMLAQAQKLPTYI